MNLLIDIDGVLRVGDKLLPGAKEFLQELEQSNINTCLLSNSTKLTSNEVKAYFDGHGIQLDETKVQTALSVTIDYCQRNFKAIVPYCIPQAKKKFPISIVNPKSPEAIVIGDMMDGWTYDLLNEMFNYVNQGAQIIAMQKNRFGKNVAGELYLDAGSFIKALEYASGKEAKLIGKPSRVFFENAVKLCGGRPEEGFTMIGDDLTADIEGAQKVGAKTILPLTGKTSKQALMKSRIAPDLVIDSLTGFSVSDL